MTATHIVVAGASLGGLRAAEQLRAGGHTGPITVLGAEPHAPYNRPPLSKEVLASPDRVDPEATRGATRVPPQSERRGRRLPSGHGCRRRRPAYPQPPDRRRRPPEVRRAGHRHRPSAPPARRSGPGRRSSRPSHRRGCLCCAGRPGADRYGPRRCGRRGIHRLRVRGDAAQARTRRDGCGAGRYADAARHRPRAVDCHPAPSGGRRHPLHPRRRAHRIRGPAARGTAWSSTPDG